MTEPRDETKLVLRLKQGDARAQRELFDLLYAVVYRHVLAKRCARSEDDALEITQDTFVRAYRDVRSFQGRSALKTWVISLSHHASVDFYRLPRNRYEASAVEPLAVHEPLAHYGGEPAAPTPLEVLIDNEDARRARDQILRAFFMPE